MSDRALRLLDLYCGAGGSAAGYRQAGFLEIVGVDIRKQPRYPFTFVLGDALEIDLAGFDAIHASPPCQRYSVNTRQHNTMARHPDLIAPTRDRVRDLGIPWVIENVVGAPLVRPVLLCGSMFGSRRLRRHRLFESNVPIAARPCRHAIQRDCISVAGNSGGSSRRDGRGRFGDTDTWRALMGIDWMIGRELAEAIPPVYTAYVGQFLRAACGSGVDLGAPVLRQDALPFEAIP